MSFKEAFKNFIIDYFLIYAGSIMGTLVFCTIFYPDIEFGLNYFRWMMLFTLIGDLPIFIFVNKKELTEKQAMFRVFLHFVILEIALISMAYFLGFYETYLEGAIFAVIVLVVYLGVRLLGVKLDFQTAKEVNQRLEEWNTDSDTD